MKRKEFKKEYVGVCANDLRRTHTMHQWLGALAIGQNAPHGKLTFS